MAKRETRKKKLTDAERAEGIIARSVEQIARSGSGQSLIRAAESGSASMSDEEIEAHGFTRATASNGEEFAIPKFWTTGPVRYMPTLKIRDRKTNDEAVIHFVGSDLDVDGLESGEFFGPVFLDLNAKWSDISAVLRTFFHAQQDLAIQRGEIDQPRRQFTSKDEPAIIALDTHRLLTEKANGIAPTQAKLAQALRVHRKTALRRLRRGRELFESNTISELRDLVAASRQDSFETGDLTSAEDFDLEKVLASWEDSNWSPLSVDSCHEDSEPRGSD